MSQNEDVQSFSDLSAAFCCSQVLHLVCFCLVQSTTMECMTWHELHGTTDMTHCIVGIQTIALYFLYLFSCFSLQRFKLVIDT